MGGIEQNGAANSVISAVELQLIECALTHDVHDLYVMADRGHTVIV